MFFQVNTTRFDKTKSSRTQRKQHPQEGHKSANRGGSESFIECAVHRHRKRIQKMIVSTYTAYLTTGGTVWCVFSFVDDVYHTFSCFELPVPVFRFRADPRQERGGKVTNSRLVLRVYEARYLFEVFCFVDPVFQIRLLKMGSLSDNWLLYHPALAAKLIAGAGSAFLSPKNACLPIFSYPFFRLCLQEFFFKIPTLFPNFCEHV